MTPEILAHQFFVYCTAIYFLALIFAYGAQRK